MLEVTTRIKLGLLLKELGLNGQGVEVGVDRGEYSYTILRYSQLAVLYSVDSWSTYDGDESQGGLTQAEHDKNKLIAERALKGYGERSKIIKATSQQASAFFDDGELDFVYLDANHSYEAVREDLALWYPKVKVGGIFAGHDYIKDGLYALFTTPSLAERPGGRKCLFGVQSAVDEFAKKERQHLLIINEAWPTWYMVKKIK